jgi:hypothetical protein
LATLHILHSGLIYCLQLVGFKKKTGENSGKEKSRKEIRSQGEKVLESFENVFYLWKGEGPG